MKNFIGVYENAYPADACDAAVRHFERMQECGLTQTRQQEMQGVPKTEKDDFSFHVAEEPSCIVGKDICNQFLQVFWADVYQRYAGEYDILKTSGAHHVTDLKAQKTVVGGGYHIWHYESSAAETSRRLLSFIVYLNDVEEGGETEFLYQSKRVSPKKGTVVVFPAAFTHTHRGNPPLSGDKYILTGWVEF